MCIDPSSIQSGNTNQAKKSTFQDYGVYKYEVLIPGAKIINLSEQNFVVYCLDLLECKIKNIKNRSSLTIFLERRTVCGQNLLTCKI